MRVLFADDALVVVDKPAGLLSVPGKGEHLADCAWRRVQLEFPGALVVHRLDMSTSGLMLFALSLAAQRALSRSFEQRSVSKLYVAIVAGQPTAESGEITLPLAADWPRRPLQKVCFAEGKPSSTRWAFMEATPLGSRLALRPLTGRTHQLRVHLSAIGHPILGDALYAPEETRNAAPRLLLHATELTLPHPSGEGSCHFISPAPF